MAANFVLHRTLSLKCTGVNALSYTVHFNRSILKLHKISTTVKGKRVRVMLFNLGCNCVTSVFSCNIDHFTFKPMNLKKFKSEVHKCIHFLKVLLCKDSKKYSFITNIYTVHVGCDNHYTGWSKQKAMWKMVYYFPSTVHIKKIQGNDECA